jgi:multidrug transporter EmrE-like cation transporter
MNSAFLILAPISEVTATTFLKRSQGFSKRLAGLAMVVCYRLSLTLLTFSFESFSVGFEVDAAYAVWSGVGIALIVSAQLLCKHQERWDGRDIGSIGSTVRIVFGFWLAGSVIHAQLATRFALATWVLGLIGFPAVVLA